MKKTYINSWMYIENQYGLLHAQECVYELRVILILFELIVKYGPI